MSLVSINESGDGCMDLNSEQTRQQHHTDQMTMTEFLNKIDTSYVSLYLNMLEREQISVEILAEMTHEHLKEIGISTYGARHKILSGIEKFYKQGNSSISAKWV